MTLHENRILEGQRVYLRDLRLSDVGPVYQAWLADPEVAKFLIHGPQRLSLVELKHYVQEQIQSQNSLFLAIIERSSHRHIGNIKLAPIDRHHGLGTIGLLIGDKSAWGKGYGTEAIRLLSDYAFQDLGLRKIGAGICVGNEGSTEAFKRAGYVVWAVRKKQYCVAEQFVDEYLMERFSDGEMNESR